MVRIGLQFTIEKRNIATHLVAFGLPLLSAVVYTVCIIQFNQAAMFASTRATQEYWQVLGPTVLYAFTQSTVASF